MKALIISDLHSNIAALEAIEAQEQIWDVIYCAGDLLEYGLYPRETLDWLRARNAQCVIGNHDKGVIDCYRNTHDFETIPPEQFGWGHHNAQRLDESDIQFLEALPEDLQFNLDGIEYGLTHHHKPSYRTRDYGLLLSEPEFDELVAQRFSQHGTPISRLIVGHSHRRCVVYLSDTKLWMNPGSTSYRRPDDLSQQAHYITITEGHIQLKQAEYPVQPIYQEILKWNGRMSKKAYEDTLFYFGPRSQEE